MHLVVIHVVDCWTQCSVSMTPRSNSKETYKQLEVLRCRKSINIKRSVMLNSSTPTPTHIECNNESVVDIVRHNRLRNKRHQASLIGNHERIGQVESRSSRRRRRILNRQGIVQDQVVRDKIIPNGQSMSVKGSATLSARTHMSVFWNAMKA